MNKEVSNTFKICLSENWYTSNDVLLQKISSTSLKYNTWYYKILNFITFKKYFNIEYYYEVKIIDNPILNKNNWEYTVQLN